MNALEFAGKYLNPYKIKGDEIIPTLCPYCHGGPHGDKGTFALNTKNLTYNCQRGSCGNQGHFSQLCKDKGEVADNTGYSEIIPKTYKKTESVVKTPTQKVTEYLTLRKISKETMAAYKIGADESGNIIFPFYDENSELVTVKFRPPIKVTDRAKTWTEADAKPILFGMHKCDYDKPLCIFEGEIDSMSGHEAGIPNCVSVPFGSKNFYWIDTCYEWLGRFKSIYLYGDSDDAGKEMINKLKLKLSDHQVFIVNHERKDANEILYRDGKEAVKKLYDKATEILPYGLINLSDVVPLDVKNIPKIRSAIQGLDSEIGGFLLGELSIWTGKRGEGKSTLLSQMIVESVEQNMSACVYSGELRADRFQYWIMLQMAGKQNIQSYADQERKSNVYFLEAEKIEKIKKWMNRKVWLYDNEVSGTNEESSIIKIFEVAAKRFDCKTFLVDNLMTAKYATKSNDDFYREQSNFVGELVNFAKKYNVHVHLVAHPKKTEGRLENDSVSGTADITNRADNVFSVERIDDSNKQTEGCDVKVTVLKNRSEGSKAKIQMNYCPESRRIYQTGSPDNKKYGWEFINKQPEETLIYERGEMPW